MQIRCPAGRSMGVKFVVNSGILVKQRAKLTAFRLSLPVLGAYWFLGTTYGLLASTMGYPMWVPLSMAILVFSGSEKADADILPYR